MDFIDTSYTVVQRSSQGLIIGSKTYPTRREAAESLAIYSQKKIPIIRDRDRRQYIVMVSK